MQAKALEIRDDGTFIAAIAVDMNPGGGLADAAENTAQRWLLRRCGSSAAAATPATALPTSSSRAWTVPAGVQIRRDIHGKHDPAPEKPTGNAHVTDDIKGVDHPSPGNWTSSPAGAQSCGDAHARYSPAPEKPDHALIERISHV